MLAIVAAAYVDVKAFSLVTHGGFASLVAHSTNTY